MEIVPCQEMPLGLSVKVVEDAVPPGGIIQVELFELQFMAFKEALGVIDTHLIRGVDGINEGCSAGLGEVGESFNKAVEDIEDTQIPEKIMGHLFFPLDHNLQIFQ